MMIVVTRNGADTYEYCDENGIIIMNTAMRDGADIDNDFFKNWS